MKPDQIKEKAREYINKQPHKKFIPGETYISSSGQFFDGDDVATLVEASLGQWYAEGKYAEEFDKDLRTFYNHTIRHSVLVNSGSSANLLAVTTITDPTFGQRQAKVGDEIITVAAGFPTTVNPIIQNGLVPVFVDVGLNTLVPDMEVIENAIVEGKTKGIILAHPLGNPFDAEILRDICNEYGIWFIEDNCDGLGGSIHNKLLGSFGDISTLSFYPAHHITAGEGGACLIQSPMVKKVLQSFRDWGKDCFPAGTKIYTVDGIKNIEDVVVGDYVISHKGNYKRVYKLTGKLDTEFVSIKPKLMKEITSTGNHPYFVRTNVDGQNVNIFKNARDLSKDDYVVEALPIPSGDSFTEFKYYYQTEYEEKEFSVPIEPDLMRLVGYWLAEGNVSTGLKGKSGYKENKYKYHRVDFSFSMREEETIDDVCNLMYKYFGVAGQVKQVRDSYGAFLNFKTRKGYEFFSQFFGSKSYGKKIPWEIETWDKSLGLDELIKGFWIGDGSSSTQGFSLCSVSETLINQIRRLLLRYKVVGSFHERKIDNHSPSRVNGKEIVSKHVLHSLNFYGENAEKFGNLIGIPFSSQPNHQRTAIFDDNYVYYPIQSISTFILDNPIKVYNLEVEHDHSYHANGLAVHNCWCPPGKDNTCGKRFGYCLGELPEGYDHKYIFSRIGYNLKATDLQAALLTSQIKKLPTFIERRRHNWTLLREGLDKYKKYFRFMESIEGANPSWFGFMLQVKESAPFTRKEIIDYLESHKIGTRLVFGGNLLRQPAYAKTHYKVFQPLVNSDVVADYAFWVGVHPSVTDEMIEYMIRTIGNFVDEKL